MSLVPTSPSLSTNLKTAFVDPFKQMFAKKPVTPAVPSFATPTPTSIVGGGQIGPLAQTTPTVPKVKTTTSSGLKYDANVAAQQQLLNSKGANLKVDGLLGPLTQAAMSKYSNTDNNPLINPPGAKFDRNTGLKIGSDTSQGDQGDDSTPVIPNITPAGQKAVDDANKAYQDSLKISPDELSTQADLDRLIESTKKGYQAVKDKVIPMEFITGQLASVEARALNLAEPLEAKLARLQAARTASLEASKFALDRADKALSAEKSEAEKASALKEGTSFYDPVTKSWIQAPSATKAAEGFTLSPGEIRYDANGKQIASGGAKPMTDSQITKAGEKQDALVKGKSDATGGLALVNEIINSPYLDQVFGMKNPLTYWTPGSNEQLVKSQRDQLIAMLSLENRSKLKGSGAISDFEAKTLEKAASALNKSLSDSDAKRVLKQIKGAFATSAGLEASVKVTSPNGETISATATRDEINQLIAEGNTVEYQ